MYGSHAPPLKPSPREKKIATLSHGPWDSRVRLTCAPSKLRRKNKDSGEGIAHFPCFGACQGCHKSDGQMHQDSIEEARRNKSERKSFGEAWRFFFRAGTAMSNLHICTVVHALAFRAKSYMMPSVGCLARLAPLGSLGTRDAQSLRRRDIAM